MCGFGAPTFGTAKPRLPEGWALTEHAPRAAFPTQSRSTHGVPIRENLGQCNELLLQRGLRDGGSPAGQRGRGQGLGVLRLRKQVLAYEESPLRASEGGKVMDARVATVRGSVSGCIC